MFDLAVKENQENTVVSNDNPSIIADLTTRKVSYCSMKANTFDEKKVLYNAMNNPDRRLEEMVKEEINVRDVYVETVDCVNKDTGVISVCPRIILIDTNNVSYACVSIGIFSAIQKLISIFGEPTWEEGLPMKVMNEKTRNGYNVLTLKF